MSWLTRGWEVFAAEPATQDWVAAAQGPAQAILADPDLRARWLRHGGTWFAGVDVLPNDATGRIGTGPALTGRALAAAEAVTGALPLHPAQLSVTYPGYPVQGAGDSDAAHRYRLTRDAAHLDGLLPEGPDRRRHLREPHGYILGVALWAADARAAPLTVYEGSHEIMRAAFRAALEERASDSWGEADLTEVYQSARRRCFDSCPRVEIALAPAEAVLLHRLTLHGIAPWGDRAGAAPEGRAIAYFRPLLALADDWLALP
jgi:hypothetical protein